MVRKTWSDRPPERTLPQILLADTCRPEEHARELRLQRHLHDRRRYQAHSWTLRHSFRICVMSLEGGAAESDILSTPQTAPAAQCDLDDSNWSKIEYLASNKLRNVGYTYGIP